MSNETVEATPEQAVRLCIEGVREKLVAVEDIIYDRDTNPRVRRLHAEAHCVGGHELFRELVKAIREVGK